MIDRNDLSSFVVRKPEEKRKRQKQRIDFA